ncbi:MAG: hypothetical protein C0624_00480 [Desulfuromonas sp.]|nr:MAG: hypothetical protein C0624_00480 [Desulfuromonas sp.]
MKLTVIADNHTNREDLTTQHGLSIWIEHAGKKIVFDTGSDSSWLANAKTLGLDPLEADMLFLSHGHWDHGGGVPALLEAGWRGTLVAHREAWRDKRAVAGGEAERNTGLSWQRFIVERHGAKVEAIDESRQLFSGAWTTGRIPGDHPVPAAPGLQAHIDGVWQAEDFRDEQTLVLETSKGLVVVTGCCHRGVRNTLETVRKMTGRNDIFALIGGLHQKDEPRDRCQELAQWLRDSGLQRVWANHCTGLHPFAQMQEVLGDDLVWAKAGMVIEIP